VSESSTIGDRLGRIRREHGLSQEDLAERAGLSRDLIAKLEQGRRSSCRITSLMKLANALDVELTELTGKREHLGAERDGGSVSAIRDAILSPSLLPGLPGLDADDAGEPTPLPELEAAVSRAWDSYWAGDFGPLVATVPGLITEARLTHYSVGPAASAVLAQAYQLAANLVVHFGRTDLAAIGAERGIAAASEGDDEYQWAAVQASYAWVLLNQARMVEAEKLAMAVAKQIEPSFSAPDAHIAVWGKLHITALWPAVTAGKDIAGYISMAAAGAERIGRRIDAYQTTFGSSWVATHAVHAYTVLKEPGEAFKAAKRVRPGELRRITLGTHLLDLAQAHVDARQLRTAAMRLQEAQHMVPVWFRHEETARSLVADIRERETRPSPIIRSLVRAVGLN
jgi:transcriptional regulator with XRE-family HTH domain